MRIQSFEEVIAWQKAKDLNKKLYSLLESSRNFVLKDQLLRASLSITNNIAEGFDRGSKKELRQFLIVARGSTAEVRSMLLVASEIGLISSADKNTLVNDTREISKLLTGFIKTLL